MKTKPKKPLNLAQILGADSVGFMIWANARSIQNASRGLGHICYNAKNNFPISEAQVEEARKHLEIIFSEIEELNSKAKLMAEAIKLNKKK